MLDTRQLSRQQYWLRRQQCLFCKYGDLSSNSINPFEELSMVVHACNPIMMVYVCVCVCVYLCVYIKEIRRR